MVKMLQFTDFFEHSYYERLQKQIKELSFKRSYQPSLHSYRSADLPLDVTSLINSKEFISFISKNAKISVKKIEAKAFLFEAKDYTLLHDMTEEKPGIDIIIDFTEKWNERFGGMMTYADGNGHSFMVPSKSNSLIIAERNKGIQRFMQYVNHTAKGRRILIIGSVA